MADEDLKAELERLKAENETLKKRRSSAVSMKVSEKGAVSVYGLGRFPVTLYQEQWNKLLSMADEIKQFIADNQDKLKVKEGSESKAGNPGQNQGKVIASASSRVTDNPGASRKLYPSPSGRIHPNLSPLNFPVSPVIGSRSGNLLSKAGARVEIYWGDKSFLKTL
jgi:hypothetical protein